MTMRAAASHLIQSLSAQDSLKRFGEGVYFHVTGWHNALSIVKSNKLKLVPSITNNSEVRNTSDKYSYYASFARTPTSAYFHYARGVIFVFDAKKLNSKYKIKPTDYWERMWLKGREATHNPGQLQTREAEDRLFAPTNEIILPSGSIKEVHVEYQATKGLPQLVLACKKLKIPVYVHKTALTFKLLSNDPDDMVKIKQIGEDEKKRSKENDGEYYRRDFDHTFRAIINIYEAKKYSHFTTATRQKAGYWIPQFNTYKSDFINGLSADIQNSKSSTDKNRKKIAKIVAIMKKHKFDFGGLYEYLSEKYQRLQNEHYDAERGKETSALKEKPDDSELWDKLERKAKKRFKKWPSKKGMEWLIEKYKDKGGTFSSKKTARDKQDDGYAFEDGEKKQPSIDEKPTVEKIYARLQLLKG